MWRHWNRWPLSSLAMRIVQCYCDGFLHLIDLMRGRNRSLTTCSTQTQRGWLDGQCLDCNDVINLNVTLGNISPSVHRVTPVPTIPTRKPKIDSIFRKVKTKQHLLSFRTKNDRSSDDGRCYVYSSAYTQQQFMRAWYVSSAASILTAKIELW